MTTNFRRLAPLALLEEARFRLHFQDDELRELLGVTDKNCLSDWRGTKGVPGKHLPVLLKIVTDRLTDDERQERLVSERLDLLLEKVRGIEEVRGLLQQYVGPLPAADKQQRKKR